jgi:DNA-binding beta-propeller fold protein YncE
VDFVNDEIWIANYATDHIDVYPRITNWGDMKPARSITDTSGKLLNAYDVAVDPVRNEVYVSSNGTATINVYPRLANGNTPPIRQIQSSVMTSPYGIALDLVNDEILVADYTGGNYLVFNRGDFGTNVTAKRNVTIGSPTGIAIDTIHNEIFVASYNSAVTSFDRLADGPAANIRQLSKPVSSVVYDALHDVIIVAQTDGIYTYNRTASASDGAERQIVGAATGFGAAYYPVICY